MFGHWTVEVTTHADGTIRVEPEKTLGPHPPRWTDSLDYWAHTAPERTFLAERDTSTTWRRTTYADFQSRARALAATLLETGANAHRPIAILSGNSIDHALLALAAMYAGIPHAPISPAYSLASTDHAKLRHVLSLLTPGLIYAAGAVFDKALATTAPANTTIWRELPTTNTNPQELPNVPPNSVAKILFTSGSTGLPKGVITTHQMLTANQQQLLEVFPFFRGERLEICDWLPWHHVFGGNHNLGLVLYNGGTFYLDGGRPIPQAFAQTIHNLSELAPTLYFNVPKGFEMLAAALKANPDLRQRFFSRLRMMFYAGAGLAQPVWDELDRLALQTTGEKVPMLTGLGATETAPFALCATPANTRAGVIGLPVPGMQLKLAPVNGKLEARLKGPNVTPGFWREPDLTKAAFDEEGYYRLGDALRWVDPQDPQRGFAFDGRLNEDFKLATGTWVSVGPLRTALLLHCAPYLRDAVIAGHDRNELTAILFPDPDHAATQETLTQLLTTFAAQSTGSSNRIARALLATEPPSPDHGEITDKGSLNQSAILRRRAHLVERLYQDPPGPTVMDTRRSNE